MRVCQFRHDGKWTVTTAAGKPPSQEDLRFYSTGRNSTVKLSRPYASFAFIVIFALSTFDTGHPFSAASAYF